MSLLLDALKKAEKAKEEAQRRARGEPGTGAKELRLEGDPPAPSAAPEKHVMTRDELPDISQPLDIHSDDIAPKQRGPAEPALALQSAPPPEPRRAAPKSAAAPRPADPKDGERSAAKKVFEAKFKEPNPRLPFYIAMGVLGAFALGTAGYFWYQLRPPPPFVVANPPAGGAVQPAGTAAPVAAAAGTAPAPVASGSAQAIPGLPGGAAPAPPADSATAAPSAQAAAQPAPGPAVPPVPAAAPARATRLAPRLPGDEPRARTSPEQSPDLAISRPAPRVHPRVQAGYSNYLAGKFAEARIDYQQALTDEPANRDALLGLAAVDVRAGNFESAEATYLRLLQADPRDANAQAGLIALRSSRMDPLVSESRVKTLLAADPNAHVLNFTLGNQLAQQGRWDEAQQQYFKAFAAEPENADFAYNLAVSMDHLRQTKVALEYYRRALALAAARGASFDGAAARERITQLAR